MLEFIVAIDELLLLQTPPAVLLYNCIVAPSQTAFPPPAVNVPEPVKVCKVNPPEVVTVPPEPT